MFKTKIISTLLLALAVFFVQAGSAAAAPSRQDGTPITGTIVFIDTETDANGVTTVLVSVDDKGVTQTLRLSVDTALDLGLVTLDPITNEPVVDDSQVGQIVEIDPTTVIPDVSAEEEEAVHPITALLSAFFGEDGGVIDGFHDDGFGFGIIAQALWMSQNLNGDASLTSQILEAKESGDYSTFTLPDGTVPANWGQFKKAVQDKHNNLGSIVSGHADPEELTVQQELGNGNGQGHGNGNGNGNGQGNNKNKDKGKDK